MTSFYFKAVPGCLWLLAVTALPGSPQTLYLSGKVVLNDGTPPLGPIPIELVCRGGLRIAGYTDVKGFFNVELGRSQDAFTDAKEMLPAGFESAMRAEVDWRSCDLRASLPGFRSDVISLAGHLNLDGSDIGQIVLYRLTGTQELTISATSALAPKAARRAYERGLEDLRRNKPHEAEKEFEKAVESYPRYALAWFALGRVREQHDQVAAARGAYMRALAADSRFVRPYERLSILAANEAKWQEMADVSGRMIHLNPYDFPNAYYFNAVASFQLGKLDAAEKSGREAVRLDAAQRNPKANYVLGLVLAQKGNFTDSAEQLRAFLNAAPGDPSAEAARKQLAAVEKLAQVNTQPPVNRPGSSEHAPVMGFH